MSLTPFEVLVVGGPWATRLGPRRAWIDALPWGEELPRDAAEARLVWTRTAFSEYASAAAFAALATRFLAAGAPVDLVAAAGDFVVDEVVHTEAAARLATALGGAVRLDVDLQRLVPPARSRDPRVAAAELAVRSCCVGETLTVPILKASRKLAGSLLVAEALARIVEDEAPHAQLGWWFLDWVDPHLDEATRALLGGVAGDALRSLAPLMSGTCPAPGLGTLDCQTFDPVLTEAATRHVARPLAERGIRVPADALAAIGAEAV